MSQVQQLIAAINVLVRQMEEQSAQIRSFNSKLEQMEQHMNQVLGSNHSAGQKMIRQIEQTREQNNQTLNRLQMAKDKLQQIRLV